MRIFIRLKEMRIIIKIGSAVLVSGKSGRINKKGLSNIISQVKELVKSGHEVVIVTSGAVASCPVKIYPKNLRAAIGQPKLMALYSKNFERFSVEICQLLYTHHDLDGNRKKYTRDLISSALKNKIVPIINANDAVSSEELDALKKYADNDVLAAKVAVMAGADIVFLLLKEDGLIDFKAKKVVDFAGDFRRSLKLARNKSSLGNGGMASKIKMAKYLKNRGIETRLVSGLRRNSIIKSLNNEKIGTRF